MKMVTFSTQNPVFTPSLFHIKAFAAPKLLSQLISSTRSDQVLGETGECLIGIKIGQERKEYTLHPL
jgi:hypothetical protein